MQECARDQTQRRGGQSVRTGVSSRSRRQPSIRKAFIHLWTVSWHLPLTPGPGNLLCANSPKTCHGLRDGYITVATFQVWKLMHREFKQVAQRHTASRWQSRDLNPGQLAVTPALNHRTPCLSWMPANKVKPDCRYFATRGRETIMISVPHENVASLPPGEAGSGSIQ